MGGLVFGVFRLFSPIKLTGFWLCAQVSLTPNPGTTESVLVKLPVVVRSSVFLH